MQLKKQENLSRELAILNYNNLGVKEDRAKIIIQGYQNPIRLMNKEDIAKGVSAMISLCAKMYCGMQEEKMMTETIQEATRMVYKHYPQIGINEIREAFSMAAANYFDNVNMTAYFGTFTIGMLGDILTAYIKYRNPVINKALQLSQHQNKEEQEKQEADKKNEEAREQIKNDIERAIIAVQEDSEPVWESYHFVPVHYAEIAVKEGWIEVSEEFKKNIWIKAQELALKELSDVANDYSNLTEAKRARLELRATIEKQIVPDAAKRIYSKLLIFEYIKMHEL